MITTGIITQADISEGNYRNNKYQVQIDYFKVPGDNNTKNYTFSCNCSQAGGIYSSYAVGDVVYIDFLYDDISKPIIIGHIYKGLTEESRSYGYLDSLKVRSTVELPENTKIGSLSYADLQGLEISANPTIEDSEKFEILKTMSIKNAKYKLPDLLDNYELGDGIKIVGNKICVDSEYIRNLINECLNK